MDAVPPSGRKTSIFLPPANEVLVNVAEAMTSTFVIS